MSGGSKWKKGREKGGWEKRKKRMGERGVWGDRKMGVSGGSGIRSG